MVFMNPLIEVALIALALFVFFNLVRRKFTDKGAMERLKEKQKEWKALMKSNDKHSTKRVEEVQKEVMELNFKALRGTMPSMLISLAVVIALFPMLHSIYGNASSTATFYLQILAEEGAENIKPIANFTVGENKYYSTAPLTVSFDPSDSTDPDGEISSYYWDFGDGKTANSETPTHTFSSEGFFAVSLTVIDDKGGENKLQNTVQVVPEWRNVAPIALFKVNPSHGSAPLTVEFDASESYDPDSDIIAYNWNFGDGAGESGSRVAHTYNKPGNYEVKLTITDNSNFPMKLGWPFFSDWLYYYIFVSISLSIALAIGKRLWKKRKAMGE